MSTIMTPPRLLHTSCMGSCSTTPKREFSLGWSLVLCPSFSPHLLHLSCHPSISLTSLSSHAWVQHTTVGLPSTFGGYGVTSWCVCHVEMGCVSCGDGVCVMWRWGVCLLFLLQPPCLTSPSLPLLSCCSFLFRQSNGKRYIATTGHHAQGSYDVLSHVARYELVE